jgi:hypothetical protein
MRYPDPNPNPAHMRPAEIGTYPFSVSHGKPELSRVLYFRTPQRSPDDDDEIQTGAVDDDEIQTGAVDDDEIQTGAVKIQAGPFEITSSLCYGDSESGGDSAGANTQIEIKPIVLSTKEVINLNQKKENNDDNTKASTIKKIKNFFQRLCCVFFKTPTPIEPDPPSIVVSSLGATPPNSIVVSSLGATPPNSIVVSSLGATPPNSIVESPRGVSPAPIESPRGEYPGVSPAPELYLKASSSYPTSSDSLSGFEKIEMFDYLVNAVDINFDKLIDDENKVNCYNELLKEVSNDKADDFKRIYREEGPKNYFKKLIVKNQKINEKQGSGNDKIKIKLFNLINEKLKFDEDTDDKRIDIANFFIKGLILKKNDIINKINKAVGDKSVGR